MPSRAVRSSLILALTPGALGTASTGIAHAAGGCSTTTPSLNDVVTCTSAGTETVAIPRGATAIRIVAIGGGGAAGTVNAFGDVITLGGNGAHVSATFTLANGVSTASVIVAPAQVDWAAMVVTRLTMASRGRSAEQVVGCRKEHSAVPATAVEVAGAFPSGPTPKAAGMQAGPTPIAMP